MQILSNEIKLIFFLFLCNGNLVAEEKLNPKTIGISISHGAGTQFKDNGFFYAEKYSRHEEVIRYDFSPYIAQPEGNLIHSVKTNHSNVFVSFYFSKFFFIGLGFLNSSNYFKQDKNIYYNYLIFIANQHTENNDLKNMINVAIYSDRILRSNFSNLFKVTYQVGVIYEFGNFFAKIKFSANGIGGRGNAPGHYFVFTSIALGFSIYDKSYYFFLEPYYGAQSRYTLSGGGSLLESGFFVGAEIQK